MNQEGVAPASIPSRYNQHPRRDLLVISLVCFGAAATVMLAAVIQGVNTSDFYGILAGAVVLAAMWVLSLVFVSTRERQVNLLNPLYGLGLWYLIHFGLMAIYNYLDTSTTRFVIPVQNLLLTGVWAAVLGYACLTAGYFVIPVWRMVPRPPAWRIEWLTWALESTRSRRALLFVCVALGWLSRANLIVTGTYHFGGGAGLVDVGDPFSATRGIFESFVYVAIAIAAIGGWHMRSRAERIAVIAIVLAELGWGFVTGSKQYAFAPLVWAFGAWYGVYGRFKLKHTISYALIAAFIILVMFPLFNAYRSIDWRSDDPVAAWQQASADTLNSATDLWASGTTAVAQRLGGSVPLSLVIQYAPALGFQNGGTFISSLFWMIPRFVWPDKPPPFNKIDFGRMYYLQDLSNFQTAQTPTVPGELYLNFGWPGIILGLLLYGAVLRAFWEWYKGTGYSTSGLIVLLMAWNNLLLIDGVLSDYFASLPRQIIVTLVVCWVVTRMIRPRVGSQSDAAVSLMRVES